MPQDKIAEDEIIVDGARLRQAFRRQGRLWRWLGPVLVAVLLLLLAALVPRSYTATTSVALEQTSGGGSALALLAGAGGGPSKRYLGILKSRSLAETVERHVQLRRLYGAKTYRTEEDAVDFLAKTVKPDDSATDGLLYVAVTLPGPPKLALHPAPSASQVEAASAAAANAYALALKEYYATSDTDQGSVLLRGADKEVRQARANYENALAQTQDFTRSLSRVDPRSAPVPASASALGAAASSGMASSGTTDAATSASGLAGLYAALNQVQAELRATQAVRATGQQLVGQQLRDLSNVPTDDPLLADARSRVTQDQSVYDTASRLYGPENPQVVQAQARLDVDQAELNRQIQGVKRSLTTPDIRSAEEIKGLDARQAALTRQIAQAERHLGVSRQLSGEAGRLEAEVGIQLDVLKTTLSEAAKIRLDNASSLNRMTVVDAAVPPKNGEPGLAKLGLVCLLLVVLAFAAAVVADYVRAPPNKSVESRTTAEFPRNGANGSGTATVGNLESEKIKHDAP